MESRTSNALSDDLIVNGIQEIIDSQLGLIPEGRKDNQELHEVSLSSSLDQVNQVRVEQGQESVSNGGTLVRSLANLHNQMEVLENSSQIEVIDEGKEEQTVDFVGGLERNEKKEKRPRRRGKGLKKHLNAGADWVGLVHDFERQTICDCEKRGARARVGYLREAMEALRYVGAEEQKKKWLEVYCGLAPDVAKEYDGLIGSRHDKEEHYVQFDPRPQFNKNKCAPAADFHDEIQWDQVSGVNDSDLDGVEDYNEDDDSDAEYVSIQRPAFVVTGEPDFDSGPPQDGLEYLRRVRWEAEHIPKVKVAKVERNKLNKEQTVYMPKIPDIAACPEHLMPSKAWEDAFLADFSKLRLALSQDESSAPTYSGEIRSIQENLDFCQADDNASAILENLDSGEAEDNTSGTTTGDWPSLRVILGMEPVARVAMLRKRIASVEAVSSLCRDDCAWLFALCAAVDTPLDANTSASLRCLLRKCASLRAEKSDLDDEIVMLNILATISGKYFGQSETE